MTVQDSCISNSHKEFHIPGGVIPLSETRWNESWQSAFSYRLASFLIFDGSPGFETASIVTADPKECNGRPDCASIYLTAPVQSQAENFTRLNWQYEPGYLLSPRTPIHTVFFHAINWTLDSAADAERVCRFYGWRGEYLIFCARDYYNDLNETAVAMSINLIDCNTN